MKKLALPPVHITTTTRIIVEADHELHETLKRYAACYQAAYSATPDLAVLLREMARRFMAQDREFLASERKLRRSSRSGAGVDRTRKTVVASQAQHL